MARHKVMATSTYGKTLVLATFFLTLIGIMAIYSSSAIMAYQKFGDSFHYVKKQLAVIALGFGSFYAVSKISLAKLKAIALPLLATALVLLCLTHISGVGFKANGASRWIQVLGINFQPAELAKLALLIFVSKALAKTPFYKTQFFRDILPPLLVCSLFAALLMAQPDFGSTVLIFATTFLLLFVAGLPLRLVLAGFATMAISIGAAVMVSPYRMSRLLSFLDPWADMKSSGFQIIQSYVSFFNGGLLGKGLGESQQKLYFLPEAHTDFVLSIIGEELGFVGILFVILNFVAIAYCGCHIALKQKTDFSRFLAFGISSIITLQAIINMGVTMGALPTKGISLPLVSSGASSVLMFLVAIGILLRLDRGPVTDPASAEQKSSGRLEPQNPPSPVVYS